MDVQTRTHTRAHTDTKINAQRHTISQPAESSLQLTRRDKPTILAPNARWPVHGAMRTRIILNPGLMHTLSPPRSVLLLFVLLNLAMLLYRMFAAELLREQR
jgi:hypothetical protein